MLKLFIGQIRIIQIPKFFYSQSKKQQLFQLSRQQLYRSHQYKPWKNVRILYNITMSQYDPQLTQIKQTSKWRQDQVKINQIIKGFSGELHILPHKQLNMLLQILKERHQTYNREQLIIRGINKQAKMLFGRQFRGDQLLKSINLLKILHFPKTTIIKMLQLFLAFDPQQLKKKKSLIVPLDHYLKLIITILQQPYIPFPQVKQFISSLLNQKVDSLQNLCSLYHISRIIKQSLTAKVQYQYMKCNVRDILFNPYSGLEETQQQQSPKNGEEDTNPDDDYKLELKNKLNQMALQIINIFTNTVDVKKLQGSIVKSFQSDIQPITKQALLFAADIVELKPIIQQYLTQNIQKLTPVQFIYLIKRSYKQHLSHHLQIYLTKLGKYMSVQQKTYLHIQIHKHFLTPIEVETINHIIQSVDKINYQQFLAITKMVELLTSQQQKYIPEILQKIQSKIPKDNPQSEDIRS